MRQIAMMICVATAVAAGLSGRNEVVATAVAAGLSARNEHVAEEASHTYTHELGALPAGNDLCAPLNLTLADAEAKCSSLTACVGITFKSPTATPTGVVKAYFKDGTTKTTGDPQWQTYLRDYSPRTYMGLLSSTLGSHMVLQRAPQQAVVWGFTAPNATVTTTMSPSACAGETACARLSFEAVAGADGTWRQRLPPTPASTTPYTLTFASSNSSAERATLVDVLFGDVYICGGQSSAPSEIQTPNLRSTRACCLPSPRGSGD